MASLPSYLPSLRQPLHIVLSALLCWLTTCPSSLAQTAHPRLLAMPPALAGLPITALCYQLDGSLWAGTAEGLAQLTGAGAKVYTLNGLARQAVVALATDSLGSLWVAYRNGVLAKLQAGRLVQQAAARQAILKGMLVGRAGVWLITEESGLLLCKNGQCVAIRRVDGLPTDTIHYLAEDYRTTTTQYPSLWLATNKGLEQVTQDASGWHTVPQAGKKLFRREVTALAALPQRGLLVAFRDSGLYQLTGKDGLLAKRLSTGRKEQVNGLVFNHKAGFSWLTETGLTQVAANGSYTNFAISPSTAPYAPLAMSALGSLAWCTQGKLWSLPPNQLLQLSREDGLPGGATTALYLSQQQELWVGTDSGLTRLVREPNGHLQSRSYLRYDADYPTESAVQSLVADRTGALWVGTRGGLYRINTQRKRPVFFTEEDGLVHNHITGLTLAKDGSIWASSLGGLTRIAYDAGTGRERFRSFDSTDGLGTTTYRGVYATHNGTLWAARQTFGLDAYNGKKFTGFATAQGLPPSAILAFAEDAQGILWVLSARHGLYRQVGARFEGQPTLSAQLPQAPVALGFTSQGLLVLITPQAVWRMPPRYPAQATCELLPAGAWAMGQSAVALLGDSLWLGTSSGLICRAPAPIGPAVEVASAASVWPTGATVQLAHAPTDPSLVGLLEYSTRLLPVDTTWATPSTVAYTRYPLLPPGSYYYQARARYAGGAWGAITACPIIVQAPYYQQLWFYAATGLLVLLCASLVAWWLGKRMRGQAGLKSSAGEVKRMQVALTRQQEQTQRAEAEVAAKDTMLHQAMQEIERLLGKGDESGL